MTIKQTISGTWNWIKAKAKWILLAVLSIGTVYAAGKIIEQPTDIAKLKTTIEADRQDNGKYKRRDKEMINGIEYEVHEYETSKGELGYQIFMRTDKYTKSIGYGVEAESRTYETIFPQPIATSTTK